MSLEEVMELAMLAHRVDPEGGNVWAVEYGMGSAVDECYVPTPDADGREY